MSLVAGTDETGGHIRAFVRDITDRRAYEQRLVEQAVTDKLTGLPDRSVLLARLGEAINGVDGGKSVGVLFIDVDRFKSVNDERGHVAGDQLLTSVAHRLRGAVRPSDTVARLGGDEFAVVCGDLTDPADTEVVAERILRALATPIGLGDDEYEVSVSIGMATVDHPAAAPEAVLQLADQAMYRAKKDGGRRLARAED
jgi:diguanylate cyclase (GGDEF)-like protein